MLVDAERRIPSAAGQSARYPDLYGRAGAARQRLPVGDAEKDLDRFGVGDPFVVDYVFDAPHDLCRGPGVQRPRLATDGGHVPLPGLSTHRTFLQRKALGGRCRPRGGKPHPSS
jgi:hypothetical protein